MSAALQAGGVELPWLGEPYARLVTAHRVGRLAHGLLVAGPAGTGKRTLVRALAAAWLCERRNGDGAEAGPCGTCRGCRLVRAGNHPDLRFIAPAEGKTLIAVDQVRELAEALALQSHAGGSKVAVIAPADAMTISAQNSLLKTLEEPPGGAILVLVAEAPGALAATIRSRCQHLAVPPPAAAESLAWLADAAPGAGEDAHREALALAGGAPLSALAIIEGGFLGETATLAKDLVQIARGRAEPVDVAARWEKLDRSRVFAWLGGVVRALAREASGAGAAGGYAAAAASHREVVAACTEAIPAPQLWAFHDRVTQATLAARGQVNPRLQMEGLLIAWAGVTRGARAAPAGRRR